MQPKDARITLADALKRGEVDFATFSDEARSVLTRIGGEAHAL